MTNDQTSKYQSEQVFVSWTGGKDSCYSCYRAIKAGLEVRYLASMINTHIGRLALHYVTADVLRAQAAAIGIPLFEQWLEIPATVNHEERFEDYYVKYKEMLQRLKALGITGGVFGDVSIGNQFAQTHWDRVEEFCRPVGIKPFRPLWGQNREGMLREMVDAGFKILIVVADNDLATDLLGKVLDHDVIDYLKRRYENPPQQTHARIYYHTFVVDGPLFQSRLEVTKSKKVIEGNIAYLDISEFQLIPK